MDTIGRGAGGSSWKRGLNWTSAALVTFLAGCTGSTVVPPTTPIVPPATSIITTVAGTGVIGNAGNGGLATAATLGQPTCVALDSAGDLYIGDIQFNTVRKVPAGTGIISDYAGNGVESYAGDGGQATAASLDGPAGCVVDSSGNLYVSDKANNVVRKITAATGIITTVAGNGYDAGTSTGGYSGDGGRATSAELNHPCQRVREVTMSTGVIHTVVGTSVGYSGDKGAPASAQLHNPEQLLFDGPGNLYIADSYNGAIRLVTGLN